ncbi:hypothetical protein PFISCL1PPCAC_1615, partial [Pristionchus fissidentatus]
AVASIPQSEMNRWSSIIDRGSRVTLTRLFLLILVLHSTVPVAAKCPNFVHRTCPECDLVLRPIKTFTCPEGYLQMWIRHKESRWSATMDRLMCVDDEWKTDGKGSIREGAIVTCEIKAMALMGRSSDSSPSSSLSSSFSPMGILLIVVSVAFSIALVVAIVFVITKFFKKVIQKRKNKEMNKKLDLEMARKIVANQPNGTDPSDSTESKPTREEMEREFAQFLKDWKSHSVQDREEFVDEMIKEFSGDVTPLMFMETLKKLLEEETHTDIWIKMLRFSLMVERDLFHWDRTKMDQILEKDKIFPSQCHERMQAFLMKHANELLQKYGDVARGGEDGEAGFMRFIAFLIGFTCRDARILKVMDDTWTKFGFTQSDASRAMVWGYRRFMDDPHWRVAGRPQTTESNGNHLTFYKLMRELRGTRPIPRLDEGSRAQHILFALGCGYETDWAEGPLAYLNDRKNYPETKYYCGIDYLWLMMGRDLVMNNAWLWMCKKNVSEHDRLCNRFGQEGKLYEHVVDTVGKYEEDYNAVEGQNIMTYAVRYSPDIEKRINFGEHRVWYERYLNNKKTIGEGINEWLKKNCQQEITTHAPKDPRNAVDYYTRIAQEWEESKKKMNSDASSKPE